MKTWGMIRRLLQLRRAAMCTVEMSLDRSPRSYGNLVLVIVFALIGAPGAGKSTLAAALASHGVATIRVSGIASNATRALVASGGLVPDDHAIANVGSQLFALADRPVSAVVLDGFPRSEQQATALLEWTCSQGWILRPIILAVPDAVLERRLAERRLNDHRADDEVEAASGRRGEYERRIRALTVILGRVAEIAYLREESAGNVLARVVNLLHLEK
jgi:adenylate kinase family enzyme